MRTYLCSVIALIGLLFLATSSFAQDFTAETLGDYGNVTVMEVTGDYNAINPDGTVNSAPRETIAKEFFRLHKDEYDFIVIFSNFDFQMPATGVAAFYLGVKNDTEGIGKLLFDYTELFGSNGKLQGIIDMGNISNLIADPLDPNFEKTLRILSHEQMHRWGAYVQYIDENGEISTALLGKDDEHWSFLLDSQASVLYGNDWKDNGDGTFTSIAIQKYTSPLDLYLMGLYEKSQVPPLLLINNPDIDPWKMPEVGAKISGTPQYISIDDIIAAEGERIPGPSESQKTFKTAFILITAPDTFNVYDLYGIENIRNGWVTRFSILTDGAGLVQVVPTPLDNLPSNPGVPEPVPPSLSPPGMENGVAWLMSNQRSDGSWQILAQTAVRDTEEAAITLRDFTSAQTNYAMGLQWLSAANSLNVDCLSRRIEALSASGQDVQALVGELISRQNADGGWGSNDSYRSTSIDTAFALRALIGIQYADQNIVSKSVDYLIPRQNPDGGWGFYQDDGNVFMTATVLGVLQKLPNTISVAAAIDKAKTYILAHQNADGGFGSSPSTVYETALSSLALKGVTTDNTILGNAVNYLKSMQADDGSWNEDPYSTALAVRVLYLTKDLPVPPPQPTTSTVTGKVVDGMTNQPLGNVMVVLPANADVNTVTNATGNFTLSKVPGGIQSISFSLPGYMTTTVPVSSTSGSIIDIGANSLYPISTAGIIRGAVTDITNGMPLADATIEVSGSFTGSASTGADGSFVIGNVTPGSLTLSASKDGYTSVSITGTISSGEVLFFYPQLSPVSTPPATGSATGKVVDGPSGQPLGGVLVVLESDTNIKTTTDSTGAFTLSNIPAGPQKISLSYSGYGTATVSANIPGGSTLDLGVLTLASNPTSGIIKGIVTDADKGQPLEGVTIAVTGSFSGSTATGADGGFVIGDVTPGTITITASKPGYYPLSGTMAVTAGEVVFFDLQLAFLPQTGKLRGKVSNATVNTPIKGAIVSISGSSTVSTDEQGIFTASDIMPGTYPVSISAPGYLSQNYQVMIIEGLTTDMQTVYLSPISTSTTITGRVTDISTGNPITNADVAIAGTSFSTKTDAAGTYTIADINLLEFILKASATGYDSKFYSMHTTAYGRYVIDFSLSRSQASNLEIIALATDRQSYSANNIVFITADIRNGGTTPLDVLINAQIMDQDNNLLAVISYQAKPALTLNPYSSEAITLQWDTGINPPGNYNVILSVVDSGKGILLADGYTTFDIASTIAVDGVAPLMSPKFLNIGSAETISLSASVTNSSNVDVSLSAEYEVKDPQGNFINDGTVDFTIAPSESLKTIALGKFTYTFVASGQYPVTVKIRSGGSVVCEKSDAIHVAPSMRIETTKILNPTTVTPEGDKRIRIDIRLQGVEVTQ